MLRRLRLAIVLLAELESAVVDDDFVVVTLNHLVEGFEQHV